MKEEIKIAETALLHENKLAFSIVIFIKKDSVLFWPSQKD